MQNKHFEFCPVLSLRTVSWDQNYLILIISILYLNLVNESFMNSNKKVAPTSLKIDYFHVDEGDLAYCILDIHLHLILIILLRLLI